MRVKIELSLGGNWVETEANAERYILSLLWDSFPEAESILVEADDETEGTV